MKKLILFGVFALLSLATFAQAPQGINYQAVVRNANNQILSNATVGVSISLRQTATNGPIVYMEHFTTTTTTNGLINLVIGTGTVDQGAFNSISWGQGPYFAEIGIDQTGGTNYNSIGTQQLMSVPYALYAETAGNPGPQGPIGLTGPQGIQGPAGTNGQNGIGISSTIDNGNGTFTFNYSDGSSFTTSNLTGPQGPAGMNGATGPQGAIGLTGATGPQGPAGPAGTNGQNGVGISSTINNGNGTYTFNYTDGSSFTTSNLTGPQGATGLTGATGPQGPSGTNGQNGVGISSTIDNGNGTFTFNYSDGSSFTTSNLTGPQGATGMTGATGPQGPAGDPATDNQILSKSNDTLFISNGNYVILEDSNNPVPPNYAISYSTSGVFNTGSGCLGNLVISNNTTMDGLQQYENFKLNANATLNIGPSGFLVLRVKDTCTINGNINGIGVNNGIGTGGGSGGGGGRFVNFINGSSSCNGQPGNNSAFGLVSISGGTSPGGTGNSPSQCQKFDLIDLQASLKGAKGGDGCALGFSCDGINTLSTGGNGGAGLLIFCKYLKFTGTINCSGANGTLGGNGAPGGGGGGGSVVISSTNFLSNTGTIINTGGNSGVSCPSPVAGGKGGDGFVLFISQ